MRLTRQVEEVYHTCDLCGVECYLNCYFCERDVCAKCCDEDFDVNARKCKKCDKVGKVFELSWKLRKEVERREFALNGLLEDWKTLSLEMKK